MKLAKKISARITFCTILSIFTCIICGGVTSCSNGSDDPEPEVGVEKTISDVDKVLFEATEHSVGSENTNIVFNYDRSEKRAKEKITIKNCDIEILLNDESLLTITNLDFTLNEYDDFTGDNATQYQCKKSIGKKITLGDTVKVVFNKKTGNVSGEGVDTAKIDTMTISLIDNDEKANWYKELVEHEKEYQPLFPTSNEESKGIVFDFTKAVTDGDVKIDNVTYCSADASKFSSENGLVLEVNNSWDGAFKIATNALDLSNKNCVVEYKIDKNWKYTSSNGKKCLIQLISKEQDSDEYKPIELSQGEFAKESTTTGSWKTETIDNIYKNDWDVANDNVDYSGADLTKIIAIKINTTDGMGTIHIKSLKFVDKE